MNHEEEMALVRKEMKILLIEFNRIVKKMVPNASKGSQAYFDLLIIRDKFARDHHNLESRYLNLMFLSNLEEIMGKEKADSFLKFRNAWHPENN